MGQTEEELKGKLREVGAVAVGIARAEEVGEEAWNRYEEWLERGENAGMEYMRKHSEVRRDPRLLLEGARSIICCAFSYVASDIEKIGEEWKGRLATYALIPDYHDWVRERVRKAGLTEILGEEGKEWRIFIDSAPILERYWAQRAGIGVIGENGALIVPGVGCEVVLCEIVTTADPAPDEAERGECLKCGKCKAVCPTGANSGECIDSNRCLSYLTIEHRGEWIDERHQAAMGTAAGRESLFGCDRCISVCPMNNRAIRSDIASNPGVTGLTSEAVEEMTQEEFSVRFKGTAIKRAKLSGLQRNALGAGFRD